MDDRQTAQGGEASCSCRDCTYLYQTGVNRFDDLSYRHWKGRDQQASNKHSRPSGDNQLWPVEHSERIAEGLDYTGYYTYAIALCLITAPIGCLLTSVTNGLA